MNTDIIIITGGYIDDSFACDFINKRESKYIIGVDKGCEFLLKNNIKADEILGDFDSLDEYSKGLLLENDTIKTSSFPSEKDDTDTQLALKKAVELCHSNADFCSIFILGATGSRIDHLLGNIHILTYAFDENIPACLMDSNNKIYLIKSGDKISRIYQHGKYVSFFPIGDSVSLSLEGFKYPLNNYHLSANNPIAISNEIIADYGRVEFLGKYLLCIESKD